jgi:hypothetical protein
MPTNFNNVPVFTLTPMAGTILPGEKFNVNVCFQPDHAQTIPFEMNFKIIVPNKAEEHTLTVQGHSWNRQAYLLAQCTPVVTPHVALEQVHDRLQLPCRFLSEHLLANNVLPEPPRRMYLTFSQHANQEVQHLVVGSIALNHEKDSSSISYSLKVQKKADDEKDNSTIMNYFSVEPMTGTLSQGQNATLKVSFHPPEALTSPSKEEDTGFSVGQWSEVLYECTLSGGYTTPAVTAKEIVVEIVLRGYVVMY